MMASFPMDVESIRKRWRAIGAQLSAVEDKYHSLLKRRRMVLKGGEVLRSRLDRCRQLADFWAEHHNSGLRQAAIDLSSILTANADELAETDVEGQLRETQISTENLPGRCSDCGGTQQQHDVPGWLCAMFWDRTEPAAEDHERDFDITSPPQPVSGENDMKREMDLDTTILELERLRAASGESSTPAGVHSALVHLRKYKIVRRAVKEGLGHSDAEHPPGFRPVSTPCANLWHANHLPGTSCHSCGEQCPRDPEVRGHVCGARGFDPMQGDTCPACVFSQS